MKQPNPSQAWELHDQHSAEILRLRHFMEMAEGFSLMIAEYTLPHYRDAVIQHIQHFEGSHATYKPEREQPFEQFETTLSQLCKTHSLVQVIDTESWLETPKIGAYTALNYHRERYSTHWPCLVIFWLTPPLIQQFAQQAPDLWAWRTAVLSFALPQETAPQIHQDTLFLGAAAAQQSQQRLKQIDTFLAQQLTPCASNCSLLKEAAEISRQLGELGQSMHYATQALKTAQTFNDRRSEAFAQGLIADIFEQRGELDNALTIRRDKALPVYEQLGDVRSKAMTMGKIADILQARGQWDEALRIRQEEQLPVYEQLGDVRSKAVTMGEIADILQARGQLDEALRIMEKEALPVYEQLGDVRSLLVGRTHMALLLWQMHGTDKQEQVQALLHESLNAAERLNIPEAETIKGILHKLNLS